MTRWLNAREWLEHERLTGLPHADFADEALKAFDELEPVVEDIEAVLNGHADTVKGTLADDVKEAIDDATSTIAEHVKGFPGKYIDDQVEWAVAQLEQIADVVGGEVVDVHANVEAADLRWWAIWDVLVEAGVVEQNDTGADVPGLLRMFLPC